MSTKRPLQQVSILDSFFLIQDQLVGLRKLSALMLPFLLTIPPAHVGHRANRRMLSVEILDAN